MTEMYAFTKQTHTKMAQVTEKNTFK